MPNDIKYEITEEKNLVESKDGITQEELNNKFGIANDKLFPNLAYNIYLPPFLVRKDLFPDGWPEEVICYSTHYTLKELNEIGDIGRYIISDSSNNNFSISPANINYILYIEEIFSFEDYKLNEPVDYDRFYIGYGYQGENADPIKSITIRGNNLYKALVWYVKVN